MKKCQGLFVMIVLILMAAPAFSQQRVSGGGRILDANMRVGGSGQNNRNNYNFNYRPDNNLFITGNVTGGMRFQGSVPYRNEGEFMGNLGQRPLDTFRRDSAGMDSLNNYSAPSMPYIDSSRSITRPAGNMIMNTSTVNMTHPGNYLRRPGVVAGQPDRFTQLKTQFNTNAFTLSALDPDTQLTNINRNGLPANQFIDENNRRPAGMTVSLDRINSRFLTTVPLQTDNSYSSMYGDTLTSSNSADQTMSPDNTTPRVDVPQNMTITMPGSANTDPSQPGARANDSNRVSLAYKSTHLDDNLTSRTSSGPIRPVNPMLSNPKLAIKHNFQQANQIKARAYCDTALSWLEQKQYHKASDSLNLALIYTPDDPFVLFYRAQISIAEGLFFKAAQDINQAAKLSPESLTMLTKISFLTKDSTLLEKRLVELSAQQASSYNPLLDMVKATLLYQKGQIDQARALLQTKAVQDATLTGAGALLKQMK